MAVACMNAKNFDHSFDVGLSASQIGQTLRGGFFKSHSVSAVEEATPRVGSTLSEKLHFALLQAREVVFQQVRYLGKGQSAEIISRLQFLLDIESWDDCDHLLRVGSVRTMIKTIIALDAGPGLLTIARGGNLVSTWKMENKVLRVEARSDGTISWAVLYPRGCNPRHQHVNIDSIDGLKVALANL